MKYHEFITLEFKRIDIQCPVTFKECGHHDFVLEKKLKNGMCIQVSFNELDSPKLYIEQKGKETYHIIPITIDCMLDLIRLNK